MELLPEPFELKVMKLALRGDAAWIVEMRKQLPYLTVANRKSIGSGFTTDFCCADAAAPVVVPRAADGLPVKEYPPAVNALRRSPTGGLVSFIVWLGSDGRIRQLEACPLTDDQWPEDLFEGFYAFQDDAGNMVEE